MVVHVVLAPPVVEQVCEDDPLGVNVLVVEPARLAFDSMKWAGATASSVPTGATATCMTLRSVRHSLNAVGSSCEMALREASDSVRPLSSKASRATRAGVLRTARYRYRWSDPTYETQRV